MIINMWLALIGGVLVGLAIGHLFNIRYRRANCSLRNESDLYFMTGKVFYKSLSQSDKVKCENSAEYKRLWATYAENEERINRTGKY